MRILAVTNLYPTPYEPERAAFNRHQLQALARLHPVRVIAPVPWTTELRSRLQRRGALPDCRTTRLGDVHADHPRQYYTPGVLRRWYGHSYTWSIRRTFRRAVEEFRPDLVLGTWAFPDGWAAVRLARAAGLPVAVKVHGCDVLCGGRGLASDPPRLRRTAEALCAADGVVAVSKHLAEHVVALGVNEDRVRTIYSGVDHAVFYPGPINEARRKLDLPQDERIAVFVGRLDPVKGIDVLLDACAQLAAAGTRFKCYIVGDGELREHLAGRVAALGIGQTVKMVGGRPQRQLGDWYRAADTVVVPSHSEGVPGVLLESAACGTPFVASRVGGIPEIAHFVPSLLVPPGDPAALARAIESRLNAPPEPRRAPLQMRDHAGSAQELAEFLEEIVARCRRPAEQARGARPDREAVPFARAAEQP